MGASASGDPIVNGRDATTRRRLYTPGLRRLVCLVNVFCYGIATGGFLFTGHALVGIGCSLVATGSAMPLAYHFGVADDA